AWRGKGFYSVLEAQGSQAPLMARIIDLGRSAPLTANSKIPNEIALGINRENVCPLPGEYDAYAAAHSQQAMPLAVAC
ncbi:fatty acid cis/trans isomerase, partial [Pseudomonas syringae pv. tagetis]|uniref:fatty acid cis/trans isomerase n=1 Tax=Pseudomonas syringae group genomosp. 7 TaxID=251699 RepID=UPI00377049A1